MSEKEKVAMFRYGVIAGLVCRRFEDKRAERALRNELLSKEWIFPDGSSRKVPVRTLQHWLGRYRKYGLEGLYDGLKKDRKNKGRTRAIAKNTLERAEKLRRELPERSAKTILEILRAEKVEVNFSERSLQRQLKGLNAVRCKLDRVSQLHQRWEQEQANDLWHGDTAHAVWLPDPSNPNKMKRTKLIAFVDDASRVCTHAEFYFDERLPSLVDTFSKALLKRGKPRRLLLDNAFIFHSTTLEVMCAELQIELSFCRPRRPQGKGKIERLIRTIKEGFVSEANRAGFTNLEDLNQAFNGWLEKNYHQSVHSELAQTPEKRWVEDEAKLTAVTPEHIRRALMLRARRRVQEQTGVIYLDGLEYTCSKQVAGLMVEVRWHVDIIDFIEVWMDGKFVETARLISRPTSLPRSIVIEEANYPTIESAKVRLEQLRQSSTGVVLSPRTDEFLTNKDFNQLVARYLEREFSATENARLDKFFKQFAPMKRMQTDDLLRKSVAVKGNALHLRYYLEQLELVVRGSKKK